jgi:hypothetical protein
MLLIHPILRYHRTASGNFRLKLKYMITNKKGLQNLQAFVEDNGFEPMTSTLPV